MQDRNNTLSGTFKLVSLFEYIFMSRAFSFVGLPLRFDDCKVSTDFCTPAEGTQNEPNLGEFL